MSVPTLPLSDGTQIPSLAWGNVSSASLHFIPENGSGSGGRSAGRNGRDRRGTRTALRARGQENAGSADLPWLSSQGTGDAKKTATESGQLAIKVGIRHIDTAQGYENEKETGESIAIAEKDNGIKAGEIYLTTKRAFAAAHNERPER